MAYASHYMPYVGATKIGNEDKNVFTIMGFGGHGMNTAPGSATVSYTNMTMQTNREG